MTGSLGVYSVATNATGSSQNAAGGPYKRVPKGISGTPDQEPETDSGGQEIGIPEM